jgi:uncharacterized protein YodC (DUF2158 family)
MASAFKKGDFVMLKAVVPQGAVEAIRMDDEGEVHYLLSWVDVDGVAQSRWFEESQLQAG